MRSIRHLSVALVVLAAAIGCKSEPATSKPTAPIGSGSSTTSTGVPTTSAEVSLAVGERSVGATVVSPTTAGPWPGVVLLAGSGPTDRDWNSPLLTGRSGSGKLLAEALAKRGVVVIRFDKAGTGTNTGPKDVSTWTLDTYREEGLAAYALLAARPDVRKDALFIAGHSEGGLHATRLALVATPKVRGVIYLASVSRSMADTMLSQVEAQMKNPMAGLSAEQVAAEMASLRTAMDDFRAGKTVDPKKASTLPPLQQLVAGIVDPKAARLSRDLVGFDNAKEAPALTVPFLVVSGAKDIQVEPADTKRLAAALKSAGRDVTVHIGETADHVLKHETKTVDQLRANLIEVQNGYNAESRTLDPQLLDAIASWIDAHD